MSDKKKRPWKQKNLQISERFMGHYSDIEKKKKENNKNDSTNLLRISKKVEKKLK